MEVGINISTKPSAYDIVLTADFNDVDTEDSMVSFDIAAASFSGGDKQFSTSGGIFDLVGASFYLYPGQTFTVTQKTEFILLSL